MKFQRPALAILALAALGAGHSVAQDSSVYISQVDRNSSPTNARRLTSQDTASRIQSNASVPAGITSTATSSNLGFDLTTSIGAANAVTAAGYAASGAGSQTSNIAVINQYGANNTGNIDQSGTGNFSRVDQYGINGRATVDVTGNNNRTVQTQLGLGANQSTIAVNGSGSAITTGQVGLANSTNISVAGDGYNITSQQIGGGLSSSITTQQPGGGLSYSFGTTKIDTGAKAITVIQTGVGSGANAPTGALPGGVAPIIQTVR
ncbi:hypothetical protein [Methylobacterium komagatae]